MAYSGGSTVGTPVANFVGNTQYAGCGNCVSTTQPCTLCPGQVFVPPPVVIPPPVIIPAPVDPCAGQCGTVLPVTDVSQLASRLMGSLTATASIGSSNLQSFGTFCGYFGLTYGIVLSTGEVAKMNVPYNSAGNNGEDLGASGPTGDDAQLTVTFTAASAGTASFRYVFASQEMPKYFASNYNDDAYIKMNGEDIALLPNGQPLAIKNVGPSKDQASWIPEYVSNATPQPGCAGTPSSMSGYVKVLTASKAISAGTNTLVVQVKDVSDGRYNTAMFLEGNSFTLTNRRTASRKVETAAEPESKNTLLPVLAACSGLIVISALFATTWMVADARARKAVKFEQNVFVGNDIGCQTEY
jgi:hypothetical protein